MFSVQSWTAKVCLACLFVIAMMGYAPLRAQEAKMPVDVFKHQWSKNATILPAGLTDPQIIFFDTLVGYCFNPTRACRTTDGGIHWTKIEFPKDRKDCVIQLQPVSRDSIFLISYPCLEQRDACIFLSADHGLTWKEHFRESIDNVMLSVSWRAKMWSGRSGYMLWRDTTNFYERMRVTTDGARSFVTERDNDSLRLYTSLPADYNYYPYWSDPKHCVLELVPTKYGDTTQIVYTANAGHTWQRTSLPNVNDPTHYLFFSNPNSPLDIYALASTQTSPGGRDIFASHDGGATWSFIKHFRRKIHHVTVSGPQSLYVTFDQPERDEEHLMQTMDGGKTWQAVSNWRFNDYKLFAPFFLNEDYGWVTGETIDKEGRKHSRIFRYRPQIVIHPANPLATLPRQ